MFAPMIDHTGIRVTDFKRSVAFYEQALAPLGYTAIMKFESWAGFGEGRKPDFWIGTTGEAPKDAVHIAFSAKGRDVVRAFYTAALAAGAKDNGPPGVRKDYHPDYYAAFVRDPDGHNIEVVCHEAYLD